ncbi:MAG: hypothetical protein ACLFTG_08485 [Alphaproteobacteria bacterium]
MDRTQLRLLLDTGPSRRLNVLDTTTRLQAEGRHRDVLFNTSFLNRSILFKFPETPDTPVNSRQRRRRRHKLDKARKKPVRTLVYLPYDATRPGDGGEALTYSRDSLRRVIASSGDGVTSDLEEDEAKLELLDGLPTLNPFLLREAFGRSGREIPEPYLALDPNVRTRLRRRLDSRVRPLALAAFGDNDGDVNQRLENVIDALLVPERGDDLQPLGRALQIDPGEAPGVLNAWAGIAFFEDEVDRLKPAVHDLAYWLAEEAEPLEYLAPAQRSALDRDLRRVRTAARAAWRETRKILDDYRDSYISLVFEDTPGPFVRFLRDARARYWRMGELFGAFEQAVSAFEHHQEQHGDALMPARKLEQLLDFLALTFSAETGDDSGDQRIRPARKLHRGGALGTAG